MLNAVSQNGSLAQGYDTPPSSTPEKTDFTSILKKVSNTVNGLTDKGKKVIIDSVAANSASQSSSDAPSDGKIRTARECLVDIAALLRLKGADKYNEPLMNLLKEAFLSERFDSSGLDRLKKLTLQGAPNSAKEDINALRSQIDNIAASCEKSMDPLRSYMNYYGRLFDSFFASEIINNPSKEMRESVRVIAYNIEDNFRLTHSAAEQTQLCKDLKNMLINDPPPWRENIPEVKTFLENSAPENFTNMLYTGHELAHALIIHLTVKYIMAAPGCYPIRSKISGNYNNVIKPQRRNLKPVKERPTSNRVGILLMHQHRDDTFTSAGNGIRPIDAIKFSSKKIPLHNQQALTYGSPLAVGMSGSANLLKSYFNHIAKRSRKFNIEQAKLLSAAELTYSGGHSINEAYTTFNMEKNKRFQPLDYRPFCDHPAIGKAVDRAWEGVLNQAIRFKRLAVDTPAS